MPSIKRVACGFAAFVMAAVLATGAMGQGAANWPSKPVRIIVNFAPGGSTDNAMRPFADRLSRALNQQFIIDNKGGASGAIGLETAVKSPPDGYTFVATPALSFSPIRNATRPICDRCSNCSKEVAPPACS